LIGKKSKILGPRLMGRVRIAVQRIHRNIRCAD
jgi:hypothetical protein